MTKAGTRASKSLAAEFRLELRLLAQTLHAYLKMPETWLLHGLALVVCLVFYAWEIAVVSTNIQIAVALPMAIYFDRISVAGLSANILVVPLLWLVVPAGFVALATGWRFPAVFAEWLLKAGEKVAASHTHFEPDWRVPDPPLWLAVSFAAALLVLAWTIRRFSSLGVAGRCAGTGSLWPSLPPPLPTGSFAWRTRALRNRRRPGR